MTQGELFDMVEAGDEEAIEVSEKMLKSIMHIKQRDGYEMLQALGATPESAGQLYHEFTKVIEAAVLAIVEQSQLKHASRVKLVSDGLIADVFNKAAGVAMATYNHVVQCYNLEIDESDCEGQA